VPPGAQADDLVKKLLQGGGVTAVQFSTAFLILRNYHFTPEAQAHFINSMAVAHPVVHHRDHPEHHDSQSA
jgi:hypothetical protein